MIYLKEDAEWENLITGPPFFVSALGGTSLLALCP